MHRMGVFQQPVSADGFEYAEQIDTKSATNGRKFVGRWICGLGWMFSITFAPSGKFKLLALRVPAVMIFW